MIGRCFCFENDHFRSLFNNLEASWEGFVCVLDTSTHMCDKVELKIIHVPDVVVCYIDLLRIFAFFSTEHVQ